MRSGGVPTRFASRLLLPRLFAFLLVPPIDQNETATPGHGAERGRKTMRGGGDQKNPHRTHTRMYPDGPSTARGSEFLWEAKSLNIQTNKCLRPTDMHQTSCIVKICIWCWWIFLWVFFK